MDILASHESVALLEPMLLSSEIAEKNGLHDLVLDLASKSADLSGCLKEEIGESLADILRSMNCYYSNLIEGHNTHPLDIEKALHSQFSGDGKKRSLQMEAKAHIEVQRWIDKGNMSRPFATEKNILELHRRFCGLLPEELLWVTNPQNGETAKVVPGQFRTQHVIIGQHIPIAPGAIVPCIKRCEQVYAGLHKRKAILTSAALHHRLLWIHPFIDGNGRVVRLLSHAILRDALDTHGLWSVARGLARNVAEYKHHLTACDQQRQGDLDGRGNLSQQALVQFTHFFLQTCLDQIAFMKSLIEPDQLHSRIVFWASQQIQSGQLPKHADRILEALLYRGQLQRSEPQSILGVGERHSRRIVAELVKAGAISSASPRSPLRLAFSAKLASQWLPGLFPAQIPG